VKRAFDPLIADVNAWYGGPYSYDPPPPAPPDARHRSGDLAQTRASKDPKTLQRVGVVLGRFRPPHVGHVHLVDEAYAQCGWLHVVSPAVPGPHAYGHELAVTHAFGAWAEVTIVKTPPPDANDPAAWADHVRALKPSVTHLFSSDPGAAPLAQALGIEHVLIDPARSAHRLSSSMIRADVGKSFHLIAPGARHLYAMTVGVVGAEGAGKSTLCRELGALFRAPVVDEGLREESARVGGAVPSQGAFERVLDSVIVRNNAARRETESGIVISDHNAVVVHTWAKRLGVPLQERFQHFAEFEHRDLWLLCHNDFPFPYAGGERDEPVERRAFFEEVRRVVNAKQNPVVEITGEGQERVEIAAAAIRTAFKEFMHEQAARM
jgi:HTH-type transcriptional regulator, transcriptional repressor of NAD biosynthesis genes